MNIFAKIYCRVFQSAFRMALPVLPYREPEIIRSCAEIGKVAKKEKISSVLIVTDKGIVNNGLVDPVVAALQVSGISYYIYADTQPNPTVQNVEDALPADTVTVSITRGDEENTRIITLTGGDLP